MTTDDFEGIVEGASESASLDFKAPMNWNVRSLVKDILAMANIQGGGKIVVGVNDDLSRTGLNEEQLSSFKEETMKDQIAEYADPYVSFSVKQATDRNGLKHVVITVSEFDENPVICRKDGADVKRGEVYYRSRSGRPASAHIVREHDMRDVLDRAVIKLMTKRQRQGYETSTGSYDENYAEELRGL